MTKNTIDVNGFQFAHLMFAPFFFPIYRGLMFYTVFNWSELISTLVIGFLVTVFTVYGYISTKRRYRNYISIYANVMFPYCVYSILSWSPILKACIIVAVIVVTLSLIFAFLVVSQVYSRIKVDAKLRKRCIQHIAYGTRVITSFAFLVLLALMGIKSLFGL